MAGRRGHAAPLRTAAGGACAALRCPCPGNVVGKADRRGDMYPAKARPERKTDAVVALLMAIGRAMAEGEGTTDLDALLAAPVFA